MVKMQMDSLGNGMPSTMVTEFLRYSDYSFYSQREARFSAEVDTGIGLIFAISTASNEGEITGIVNLGDFYADIDLSNNGKYPVVFGQNYSNYNKLCDEES